MVLPPPLHAPVHPSASGQCLQHLAREFKKETKDLNSIAVFLPAQESGRRVQERPVESLFGARTSLPQQLSKAPPESRGLAQTLHMAEDL